MMLSNHKNKKIHTFVMPKSIADADCPYFCFRKIKSFFDLHKRQTAHVKHKKEIRFACKHDMSSFCDLLCYIVRLFFEFVNSFFDFSHRFFQKSAKKPSREGFLGNF
jgi:hypothetical protein